MPLPTFRLAAGHPVKLGRQRPKARGYAPRFAAYLDRELAAAAVPDAVDYVTPAAPAVARVYLNDTLGCCVIADRGHTLGVWTANETGTPVLAADAEIDALYRTICGPGDNGCVITDVLDYARDHGLRLGGTVHKIDGYVALNWADPLQVKAAVYLFGSVTLGINLPQAWMDNPTVWDVTNSGVIGGHDVPACGYDARGVTILTWGGTRLLTWAALADRRWVEEAFVPLSPDWYARSDLAPCGLDAATLRSDLDKIGGGTVPPLDPNPPPTPPPGPTPPDPGPAPAPTGLTLATSARSAPAGSPVTFTASVTPQGVTGSVIFNVDAAPETTLVPVLGGKATLVLTGLAVGTHGVTARFAGSPGWAPSAPIGITQTITPAPGPNPPPTPVPAGPNRAAVRAAIVRGIEKGRPYPMFNAAARAEAFALAEFDAAWPPGPP